MSCRDLDETLLLLAAGAADRAEAESARAHLQAGCPACAGRYAEAQATVALLPLALDPVAPSPAVRERLLARAASQPVQKPAAPPAPIPFPARTAAASGRWSRPVLAAAAAAAVVALAIYVPLSRDRAALRDALAREEMTRLSLEGDLARAVSTIERLRSPQVQVVSLKGTEPAPSASARIFVDRARREWQVYTAGLKPLPEGRTYELWFITPAQEKIAAGTFAVNERGEGELRASVPAGLEAIALAAVTDEPAGGSAQPTGSIHLVGEVPAPAAS